QQNGDGTALAAGAMATSSTVQLTATSASETCGTTTDVYRIQIELQPLSTPFTGTATYTSPTMIKTSCVLQVYPVTVISNLPPGDYHWQAREQVSTLGVWVTFNAGSLAFTTGPA